MSSNSDSLGTTTLGARANFFDSQSGEFDLEREPKDPKQPQHDTDDDDDGSLPTYDEMLDRDRGSHSYAEGTSYDDFIGNSLLREYKNPDQCCPRCKAELERFIPLSDPEHHLPPAEVNQNFEDLEWLETSIEVQKHDHRRHRHCPDCGLVSFGGTIPPRETDELLTLIQVVIDSSEFVVLSRDREELLEAAKRWKSQDKDDSTIIGHVVMCLRYQLDPDLFDER